MGSGQSLISKDDMEAYKELTYFTEAEITSCLKRFQELLDSSTQIDSIHHPQARVRQQDVVEKLKELRVNPFAARICQVFSQRDEDMEFEEFLDMLSSLSVATPTTVRAEWAFKVFDYDGDNLLGREDIRSVVDAITGTDMEALGMERRQKVVKNVLNETDLNRTGQISLAEFKQMVVKSPDFANNFRIRL